MSNDTAGDAIRCRFGCDNGLSVALYHIPDGCWCWDDPVQALCEQHAIKVESAGPITQIAIVPPGCAVAECGYCGVRFLTGPNTGRRSTAKFCKDLHRVYAHQKRPPEKSKRGPETAP